MNNNKGVIGLGKIIKLIRMNPALMYWVAPFTMLIILSYIFFSVDSLEIFIDGIEVIFTMSAPLTIMALGVGLVLASGEVDISISGVATFTGILFAIFTNFIGSLVTPYSIFYLFLALIFSVIIGSIIGALSGRIVVNKKAPSLVSSWAIGGILFVISGMLANSGLISWLDSINESRNISTIDLFQSTPADFFEIPSIGFGLVLVVLFLIIVTINFMWLDKRTQAVGANADSAVYAGINPGKTIKSAFIFCACCAAISGVLVSFIYNGAPSEILGKELVAIAIAVLGGTALSGGYYNPYSIFCASILWSSLEWISDTQSIEFLGNYQAYIPKIIFCVILLLVLFLTGERLGNQGLRNIYITPRTR
ncbi:MAG: hypothetical protein MK214_14120 [Thalassotalea sp.]|nr:hypothetical protein [Thalassotalea sp.]